MEVPRLGVESEPQLPAYISATAAQDPHVFNPYHGSLQCWILNLLREARDQSHFLVDTNHVRFCCASMGTHGKTLKWLDICVDE